MEFQMTITTKVERLSAKQASMLATVVLMDVLEQGVDITGYLLLEYLYSFLSRNQEVLKITIEKHRRIALILELFLNVVRGTWFSMSERVLLGEQTVKWFTNLDWLPTVRTLASWKNYWQVEKFFQVRIVPLEHLMERSGYSTRYSSYCKGYGDGGHISRVKKTPYDSELDGDGTDRDPPGISLLDFEMYQSLILSIESEKARRVQRGP
jgi:hypothetical protein